MSTEALRQACELAFSVARDGAEAAEPIEPPAAMRSFLYVDDLPRRAIAVAQQAIEENSEFRHRVALRADEQEIGRAGYLWLRRPTGWAQEFEELATGAPSVADDAPDDTDDADDAVFATTALGPDDLDDLDDPDHEDPDDLDDLEEVYRGLTAEPLELVTAQPPVPDLDVNDRIHTNGSTNHEIPLATVRAIRGVDADHEPGLMNFDSPSIPSGNLGLAAVTDIENADLEPAEATFGLRGPDDGLADVGSDDEADALENELASLRGLVARLANERDTVVSSVPDLGSTTDDVVESHRPADKPIDVGSLRTDLEALQHELYLAQADLTIVRQEREEAQRLQSEALKRQVQLERELTDVRSARAELENHLSTSQAKAISVEERSNRIETQLAEADHERQVVKNQLETMTLERNQIRDERSVLRVERDDLRSRLNDINEKTGGVDVADLVQSNRTATTELAETSRELARMITQAEQFEEQAKNLSQENTGLKTERMDLRSRLGEAETSLDVITTQYEALRIDSERMAADLGALRAERDGLQIQLAELQTSLSEMLADQAEVRQRNDIDRRALNELRVERDVVMARLADLEQAEREGKARIEGLVSERDELLLGRDELLDERGQLRAEMATLSTDRAEAQQLLASMEGQLGTAQTELQRERRQREELANRLLQLDEQSERYAAEQASLVLERDDLIEIVERLENERTDAEQFRRERDSLASELADTRSTHRQELDQVTSRLDAVAAETDELRTARETLDEQLAARVADLSALQAELSDLHADRIQLVAERDQSTAELDDRRASSEAIEAELAELRAAMAEATSAAEEASVALQVKESELRTVLGARSVDAAEIEKLRTNLAEAMLRADEKVAEKSQELAEINEQLAARSDELADMDEQLAVADRQVADIDQRLEDANQRLAGAETKAADADLKLADAEAQLAAAEARVADAEARVADADAKLEGAEAKVEEADTRLADADAKLADADHRLEDAERLLDEADRQLEETNRQLADRDRQLAESNEQFVDAARQVAESDARLASQEAELDLLRAEVEALRATSAELSIAAEERASDQAAAFAAAQAEQDANASLQQAEHEAARLRDELAATRLELASASAELDAHAASSAPPVPPSVVGEYDDDDANAGAGDELDSMAAEVRSALRGPSVLDTIIGVPSTPPANPTPVPAADPTEKADASDAVDEAGEPDDADEQPVNETLPRLFGRMDIAPAADQTARLDVVPEHLDAPVDESIADDLAPIEDDRGEPETLVGAADRHAIGVEADEPSGWGQDLFETALPVAEAEPGDDDELDLVSKLIAQTVSSFSADEIADLPDDEDDVDATAETVRPPVISRSDDRPDEATPAPPSILGAANQARPAEQPDLGARRSGASKRRGIEIPGDIMDDEIAVARYVVSTPDVVLLVDGDSVSQLGWPKLPVPQQRDALVTYLADLSASSGAAPDVVFDGRIGGDESLPASRAVRIRLSTPPTPPTAALEELVDAYPQQWPIALVTDDADLAAIASERGAAVLNNGQLLDLFIAE